MTRKIKRKWTELWKMIKREFGLRTVKRVKIKESGPISDFLYFKFRSYHK